MNARNVRGEKRLAAFRDLHLVTATEHAHDHPAPSSGCDPDILWRLDLVGAWGVRALPASAVQTAFAVSPTHAPSGRVTSNVASTVAKTVASSAASPGSALLILW